MRVNGEPSYNSSGKDEKAMCSSFGQLLDKEKAEGRQKEKQKAEQKERAEWRQ